MTKATPSQDVPALAGYTVQSREHVDSVAGTYLLLEHDRTGARHIHIECADDNNGFAVVFPTVPADSTGVAHILEHVVLAGSRRYPVHDPFFSMTRRSLATFMNAFTGADSTIYLFSTRNARDYANLLEVYLDAAFFPRLEEDSFRQEGVRFEFDKPDDPQSGLRYKGVVYNEMKGALATPHAAVDRAIGKALFPGLTYAHVSGGDPEEIPNLTWEQLRRFHAVHYHPSNAYFYTYGNRPLESTLELIERNVLSRFERSAVDTSIPNVKRHARPVTAEEFYPVTAHDGDAGKSQALTAWVTIPSADSFRLLAMRVLSEVLLANAGSPLRKALVDSGLGTAMADGSGLHDDYREAVFGAGLKGVDPQNAGRIQEVVLDTLRSLADEGLDEGQVDAAIRHLEFEKRERSNAGFPYALKVLFTCMPPYRHGGDPYKALNFDADLEHLQKARAEGRFFENLIRAELLDNPHRALVTIRPDPELDDRRTKQELARLAAVERSLQRSDRDAIVADALRLKAQQDAKQDLTSLPTLELTDIPMVFEDVPSRIVEVGEAQVEFYPQPTNGITYLDLRADFAGLTQEQKDLLPLFSRVLTQSGAAGLDYVEIASRIATHTGGVGAAPQVQSMATGHDYLQSFVLSGRALDREVKPFIGLLADLTARLEIDPKRLREIIGEVATRLESSIAGMAFQFAVSGAHARMSSEGALNDHLQGVTMLMTMRRLAAMSEKDLPAVVAELDEIRRRLFTKSSLRAVVTCGEDMVTPIQEQLAGLVEALPEGGATAPGSKPDPEVNAPEARTAPVPVAFNVRIFHTASYTHPDAAPLLVLANYMKDTFLHRELREKGGAYGGYAVAGIASGTFYLGSYRDPNIVRTYETFDRAVAWVTDGEIEEEALKEAILGACGDVDPLESPDIKGRREATNRSTGFTRVERERFKQRLLAVGPDDLRRVARTYLVKPNPIESTVSGPELIQAALNERPGLFKHVEPI